MLSYCLSTTTVPAIALAFFSALLHAKSTAKAAGFIASDGSVSFALSISDDQANDTSLYLTLEGPSTSSWISVGMGNTEMQDTLMFIIYPDSTGKDVTISPRLSYDNTEPSYTPAVSYTVGHGSGISNGTMTAKIHCQNCRSWNGGFIDPTDTGAEFIFASGLGSGLKSDSPSAGLQEHSSYGSFSMDLTKAVGDVQFPSIATADTSGTVQESEQSDDKQFLPAVHGALMVLSFFGLMPVGVFILRGMNSVKWHALNQTLSVLLAVPGTVLGIYLGTLFNRSRNFHSAHQIIGIIVTVALIAQFVLGFVHHRIYKRTAAPTGLATYHVWLGRVVIVGGIACGFAGFPLALNAKYNWALLGIAVLLAVLSVGFIFLKASHNRRHQKTDLADGNGDATSADSTRPASTYAAHETDIHLHRVSTEEIC